MPNRRKTMPLTSLGIPILLRNTLKTKQNLRKFNRTDACKSTRCIHACWAHFRECAREVRPCTRVHEITQVNNPYKSEIKTLPATFFKYPLMSIVFFFKHLQIITLYSNETFKSIFLFYKFLKGRERRNSVISATVP